MTFAVSTTDNGYEVIPNAFVQAWLAGTITLSLHLDSDGLIEKYKIGITAFRIIEMQKAIEMTLHNSDYL